MVWVIWPSKNIFWERIIGIVTQRVRFLYHISEGAPRVNQKHRLVFSRQLVCRKDGSWNRKPARPKEPGGFVATTPAHLIRTPLKQFS